MSLRNAKVCALKQVTLTTGDAHTDDIVYLRKLQGKSNVVQLIDEEFHGNCANLVLEYGKESFSDVLKKNSFACHSDDQARYWKQMVTAVKEIHTERIIHGDIKPQNFLVVGSQLKLTDFGYAQIIPEGLTKVRRQITVGSGTYLSPEEATIKNPPKSHAEFETPDFLQNSYLEVGLESDIWSLGCILYQMTYKRLPYGSSLTLTQTAEKLLNPNYKIKYDKN